MKRIFLVFALVFCFESTKTNAQFLNFNSRNIIYTKSLISETRFKRIWLTNQSVWQLSRPTTFVNLSEIFIILNEGDYEGINHGVAFINGQDYNINYLGGQFLYEQGFLYKIINKYADGSRIMLDDYSEWDLENEDYKHKIVEWFLPKHVVLDQNKNYLIDPQSQVKIRIKHVVEE